MGASTILGRNNVWPTEGRIFGMINDSENLITSLTDEVKYFVEFYCLFL